MKISIITVTKNSEGTIRDTLDSINQQSYPDIEHIVVDSKSTDSTLELIDKHGTRVTKLLSENDKSIYDGLNKGINMSSGDIIGFLHSDDTFAHNNVIKNIAYEFQTNNIDAVYGNLDYVSKKNTNKIIRRWVSGEYSRFNLRNGWMPPHPTFYMKRKYYLSLGSFNLKFNISADYESILRYLWKNKLDATYIPDTLVKMKVGGESNRSLTNILKKMIEDRDALKMNKIPVTRAIIGKNFSKLKQFYIR